MNPVWPEELPRRRGRSGMPWSLACLLVAAVVASLASWGCAPLGSTKSLSEGETIRLMDGTVVTSPPGWTGDLVSNSLISRSEPGAYAQSFKIVTSEGDSFVRVDLYASPGRLERRVSSFEDALGRKLGLSKEAFEIGGHPADAYVQRPSEPGATVVYVFVREDAHPIELQASSAELDELEARGATNADLARWTTRAVQLRWD